MNAADSAPPELDDAVADYRRALDGAVNRLDAKRRPFRQVLNLLADFAKRPKFDHLAEIYRLKPSIAHFGIEGLKRWIRRLRN